MLSEQRTVLTSFDDLVSGATSRVPMDSVGVSGASLERVVIDGDSYVLKHLDPETDWTMRAAGIPGGPVVELWRRGVLDALPACLHQPIVGVASDGTRTDVLMRDVGGWLFPADGSPLAAAVQDQVLDHMAAMHVKFWGRSPEVVPARRRYLELSPSMALAEARRGDPDLVPRLVAQGWPLLERLAPGLAGVVLPLADNPEPLLRALAGTPETFVHGNWKLDNIGADDEGRTVVLDWELPGAGAPLSDLAWFLAINCRRLATSKEDAIATYRSALERRGIDTVPWWSRQLGLCLVGAMVQFGWEKALGGYDEELAWWEERVVREAVLLQG